MGTIQLGIAGRSVVGRFRDGLLRRNRSARGWPHRSHRRSRRVSFRRQGTAGTVVIILPFNYPLVLLFWEAAAAHAAVNAVIVKPHEQTRITTLPTGLMRCRTGGPRVARRLIASRKTRGVAYAGSVPIWHAQRPPDAGDCPDGRHYRIPYCALRDWRASGHLDQPTGTAVRKASEHIAQEIHGRAAPAPRPKSDCAD